MRKARVLIVDDSSVVRKIVERSPWQAGRPSVATASNRTT
jgi:hypothetical protein